MVAKKRYGPSFFSIPVEQILFIHPKKGICQRTGLDLSLKTGSMATIRKLFS